jgi:AbrB family looped-hinge helix DNA binding protein
MPLAKLSSKSQLVLPADIRRKLNIHPGDQLEIAADDQVITIRKAATSFADALEACASDLWCDYATELSKARNEWDT